jgi:hypothetical protein
VLREIIEGALTMPDLLEGLRNIEEDRYAISTYFHIVVYSFNNSAYLLYSCIFTLETKLMIGNQSLYYYREPWE